MRILLITNKISQTDISLNIFNTGEANIGLIYSTSRSVGKTTALEVLAYGQGCQRKDHPLLVSLGDQCISGTSL